jgi:hypothetical protein
MPLERKDIYQKVLRQFGGSDATGWAQAVTLVDVNGVAVSLGGGGGGSSDTQEATQLIVAARLLSILTELQGTLDIAAASLPLPAGAATQATLAAIQALLAGTLSVNVANAALEIVNDVGNPVPISEPRTTATLTETVVTANGSVATGAISVSFYVTAGTLTINGTTYPTGARVYYRDIQAKVYPAIAYTVSGGASVSISEVR